MPNRYNQLLPNQEYVSQYVPLPLETLYHLGKDADANLDTKIKATESSLDPFAKLKLNTSFRIYDPNSPNGESTYSTQALEDSKNEIVNSLDNEREQVVNDYIGGKIDNNTFNIKNRDIINKAKNAYSKFAGYQPLVESINKNNEEIAKNEAFGKDRAYGTKLLEYHTRLAKELDNSIKNGDNGVGGYTPIGISKEINREEVLSKDQAGFAESDMGSTSYSDDKYIHDLNTKGVTGTRVYDYVNNNWNSNSYSPRAYAELKLSDYLNSTGSNYNDEIEYKDYKKDKNGNIVKDKDNNPVLETKKGKLGDVFMEQEKHEYTTALSAKVVHQVIDTKMSTDGYGLQRNEWAHKKEEDRVHLEQQTQEGRTYDLLKDKVKEYSPDMVDSNGNVDFAKVTTEKPSALWEFIKQNIYNAGSMLAGNPLTMGVAKKADKEEYDKKVKLSESDARVKVAEAFQDMATFMGYEKQRDEKGNIAHPNMSIVKGINDGSIKNSNLLNTAISPDEYQDIYNQYSKYQKARGTALVYDERVKPQYDKQINDQPDNYVYYNEKGVVITGIGRDKILQSKKEVLGRDRIKVQDSANSQFAQIIKTDDGKTIYAQYKGKDEKVHYERMAAVLDSQDTYVSNYRRGQDLVVSNTLDLDRTNEVAKKMETRFFSDKNLRGMKVATVDISPETNNEYILTIVDPRNPLHQEVLVVNSDYQIDTKEGTADFVSGYDSKFSTSNKSAIKGDYNKNGSSLVYGVSGQEPTK